MKQFTIIITILLFPFILMCQVPYSSGYGIQSDAYLPKEYSDKYSEEIQQRVPFVSYTYSSAKIDLRDFKSRYPKLSAPDFIEILPPVLSDFSEVVVLISLMISDELTEKDVVIWLAGDYAESDISFFTDNNLDRNFNNDGLSIKIKRGKPPVKIIMGDVERGSIPQDFWIAMPRKPRQKNTYSEEHSGIINQFAIGINAGVGFGDLNYQFDNLNTGFPTWYNAKFTEKNIGLSFSYSSRNFRLGLSGNYQGQGFYTTYYNVQKGESFYQRDANGIRRLYENIDIQRNIDVHSATKIQLAAEGMLRIRMTRLLELQPIISAGFVSFLSGEYIADSRFEQIRYEIEKTRFIEGGLRAEFKAGENRALFIGFTVNNLFWNPTNFKEDIPHENLDVKYLSYRWTAGYYFGL